VVLEPGKRACPSLATPPQSRLPEDLNPAKPGLRSSGNFTNTLEVGEKYYGVL